MAMRFEELIQAIEEVAPDLPYMPVLDQKDEATEILRKMNINLLGAEVLFDNEDDPYQMNDLSADPAAAELKNALHERLRAHVERTDAFLNGDDYIRFCGRIKEFNESQIHFGFASIAEA